MKQILAKLLLIFRRKPVLLLRMGVPDTEVTKAEQAGYLVLRASPHQVGIPGVYAPPAEAASPPPPSQPVIEERGVPIPMFHPIPLDPAEHLRNTRENNVVRAFMTVLEQHLATRQTAAGAESVQQFPSVAAYRAGMAEALAQLHGAVCRLVDGR